MTIRLRLALGICAATVVVAPLVAQQRGQGAAAAGGTVARYDMRAGTVSGMGGMGRGAGAVMGMMMGGGRAAAAQHELQLRLGSNQSPRGAAKADHFMPPAARLGKSVALVTPREEREADILPQKPRGRLLIYWGCGERAGRGQPVVIDFARLASGQAPPGLWTTSIPRDRGPSLQNSRTFGRWPADDGKTVKAESSLLGAHRVVSTYAPDIAFTATRDFMAPLRVNSSTLPGGASLVRWTGIPDATGYLVGMFGGKQGAGGEMGDMVMWTSSATRQFGGGLADWLSPAQVAPLVRDRTLLAPAVATCTVPIEVIRDAADFRVGTLTAFGPEETFSYPPRPAGASAHWSPEWIARIRHRSTTSWMQAQGMSMGANEGDGSGARRQGDCRPRGGGLGGLIGGALGGGKGC